MANNQIFSVSQNNRIIRSSTLYLTKTKTLEIAWVFLWLATISFTKRTAAESLGAELDAVHLLRMGFVSVAFFLLVFNLISGVPKLLPNSVTLFFLYMVLSVISTLWSASPFATLGKSAEAMIAVLIVLKVMSGKNPLYYLRRLFNWYLVAYGGLLVFAVCGFLISPESFSQGRFRIVGPFLPNNSVSYYSALIATIALAKYFVYNGVVWKKNSLLFIYLLLSGVCVYAQGRGAMIVLFFGSALLLFMFRRRILILLSFPLLITTYFLFADEILSYFLRGQLFQEVFVDVSGRRFLWELGLDAFKDNPYLGVGFAVGSRVVFLNYGVEWYEETISTLHNGVLEVLLGTGLCGFFLWVSSITYSYYLFLSSLVGRRSLDISIVFVYIGVITFTQTGVGGWMGTPIGLFLVASAYLIVERSDRQVVKRETLVNRV